MVDFYGFHVGKYTSPMDPIWSGDWMCFFRCGSNLGFQRCAIGSRGVAAAMGPMRWDSKDGRLSRNDMFPMAALLKVAKVVIFLKQDKGSTVKVQPWGSKSTIKIIGRLWKRPFF